MQHAKISMALSAVSLRDLALVQAVARESSFARASARMHISPSGLSHQIQKVEQALGATLFERGSRHTLLTALGRRLLAHVDAVLDAAEGLERAAQDGEAAFGGELRLGVPATLGPYLLPHLIEPFPQRFPGARLALSEGKLRGLLRRLREGELDAVIAPRTVTANRGLGSCEMFFEPYELLLNASHPLAERDCIALGELNPDDATFMAEGHDADVQDALGAQDVDGVEEKIQDVSLESLATLVVLRGGYALVPSLAHARLASIPRLALARIDGTPPGREIRLYWRQASPWQADLEAFGALIRHLAASIPALRVDGDTAADAAQV
jgi:LysR family transcriptional regulator, hydrogen peroxide-inducible genes activator